MSSCHTQITTIKSHSSDKFYLLETANSRIRRILGIVKTEINIKRAYEPADASDGHRILVDRIWPRGVKKEEAEVSEWIKEAAPTTELRKWFNHDPEKWKDFEKKYLDELKTNAAADELLNLVKKHKKVTLVYSARDEEHNQAVVLKEYLEKKLKS